MKEELGLETVETAIKQEYLVRKVNYAKKKLRDSGFVSVDGAAVEAEVITETTIPSEENYWGFDMDDDDDEDKVSLYHRFIMYSLLCGCQRPQYLQFEQIWF